MLNSVGVNSISTFPLVTRRVDRSKVRSPTWSTAAGLVVTRRHTASMRASSAGAQPFDAIVHRAECRHDQHGRLDAGLAHLLEERHARFARQHQVEDDQVETLAHRLVKTLEAVADEGTVVAGLAQALLHRL